MNKRDLIEAIHQISADLDSALYDLRGVVKEVEKIQKKIDELPDDSSDIEDKE